MKENFTEDLITVIRCSGKASKVRAKTPTAFPGELSDYRCSRGQSRAQWADEGVRGEETRL